jgi:hypothetical protein
MLTADSVERDIVRALDAGAKIMWSSLLTRKS